MDKPCDFQIMDCGRYFTIENVKAKDFDNYHTHINKKTKDGKKRKKGYTPIQELLIQLICEKRVPTSHYLRISAKRISRDEKYIQKIDDKIRKDASKQKFFKVNNGKW